MFKNVDFILREATFFAGLGILFYGLYLNQPWLAFTVTGAILTAVGGAAIIIRR